MLVRTCCLAEEGVEADDELVLVVGVVAALEIGAEVVHPAQRQLLPQRSNPAALASARQEPSPCARM